MLIRAKCLVSLLLVLSILQFSVLLTRSAAQLNGLASTTTTSLERQANNPCLTPTVADTATAQMQASSTKQPVSGHVLSNVAKKRAHLLGAISNQSIIRMEMVLNVRNPTSFNACLASLNDPTSPNYGHYLNQTTLKPYLPTPGQVASITSYLSRSGFHVASGFSPLVLQLTATTAVVESTLNVKLNLYSNNTSGKHSYYGVSMNPSLPNNFATLVNGIQGLDNYSTIIPAESPCSSPYCPQGVQVGYGLSSLYSSGFNGAGQSVAIVDMPGDPNIQSALNTFDSQYGLPATTISLQYPDGPPGSYNPGWASETAMDVEAVHSMAPGANIVLLYDSNLMNSVDYVATNHLAKIVSDSWTYGCGGGGSCSDTELSNALVSSVDTQLALDAAQGLTVLFASGDEGAKPDGGTLGTEFPASDPNVLSVGANTLVLSGCSTTTCSGYGSESGAVISGGGISGYFSEPSWQTATIGSKGGRGVPDVSMLGYNPNFWVYSTASDECGRGGDSAAWFSCAGTSLSTPLWAGVLAVALQFRGGASFGNIGPLLYHIAAGSGYSSIFHDVTSGSNGLNAGPGWDPVTGWGSPIASVLGSAISHEYVTTDRGTYHVGDSIDFTGSGFTANGVVLSCLSVNDDGVVACTQAPAADANGNVAGAMVVGGNVGVGSQEFYLYDEGAGLFSSGVPLTILAPLTQTSTTTTPTTTLIVTSTVSTVSTFTTSSTLTSITTSFASTNLSTSTIVSLTTVLGVTITSTVTALATILFPSTIVTTVGGYSSTATSSSTTVTTTTLTQTGNSITASSSTTSTSSTTSSSSTTTSSASPTTSSSTTTTSSSSTGATVHGHGLIPLVYPFFSFGVLVYLFLRLRFTKRRWQFGVNGRLIRYEE